MNTITAAMCDGCPTPSRGGGQTGATARDYAIKEDCVREGCPTPSRGGGRTNATARDYTVKEDCVRDGSPTPSRGGGQTGAIARTIAAPARTTAVFRLIAGVLDRMGVPA